MTFTPLKSVALTGLAALGALTLAASVPAAAQAPKPAPQRQCFNANSVNSFTPVDDEHVILRTGVRDHYELTLLGTCRDIDWTWKLGVRTRGGGSFICSGLDADIIVPDRNFPQRCPVKSIRKLSVEEVKALEAPRSRTPS